MIINGFLQFSKYPTVYPSSICIKRNGSYICASRRLKNYRSGFDYNCNRRSSKIPEKFGEQFDSRPIPAAALNKLKQLNVNAAHRKSTYDLNFVFKRSKIYTNKKSGIIFKKKICL